MITVIMTISITVAVVFTLTSNTVLIHIIRISTIVAIIVPFVISCTMNITIITASDNASMSIPAPILLLSLLLLVLVPSSAQ